MSDENPPNNVTSIKKAPKPKTLPKLPKLEKGLLINEIAKKFCGLPTTIDNLPDLQDRMRLVSIGEDGVLCLVDEMAKTIEFVTNQRIRQIIQEYIENIKQYQDLLQYSGTESALSLDRNSVVSIVHAIEDLCGNLVISDWRPIRQLSEPGWCVSRLDFDIAPVSLQELNERAPATSEWLSRCDNPQGVARWLYELISGTGSAKRQLWLWGEKNSLKSSLIESIGMMYSKAFTKVPDAHFHPSYRWLGASLVGKSLVLVDEADPSMTAYREWKTVTGSETMSVEIKGGSHSVGRRTCRFVCTSNFPPNIPADDDAVASRLVIVHITAGYQPSGADWLVWKKTVAKELNYLLGFGLTSVSVEYPKDSDAIKTHRYMDFMTAFIKDPCSTLSAMQMQIFMKDNNIKTFWDQREFKALLKRVYDVEQVFSKVEGKCVRNYKGIRFS